MESQVWDDDDNQVKYCDKYSTFLKLVTQFQQDYQDLYYLAWSLVEVDDDDKLKMNTTKYRQNRRKLRTEMNTNELHNAIARKYRRAEAEGRE